ncbi:AEC family transporter [Pseudomonas sp. GD03842]|uniref:AEC family transporter n=1 Tax=unclassified Pseudomonas TaxID=196821 RepID=UPI000D34AEFC|nr:MULTISPECIES: AEC family transporter [unclassified Pseudomonas]MDH0746854.1 AEC family transporter [Pseudomonas sp. GD03842]RAU43898.1 AEC family transporter [Pseudomonas sp. RIT 409]RAU56208.1 AEC family transporter [Pseudomonas sp. RIT 412]
MMGPVFQALIPVVTLIVLGYLIVRVGWLRAEGMRDISNVAFLVLAPALLFRSMATVHLAEIDFTPVALYFCAIWVVFTLVMVRHGFNKRAAVLALSTTFSNTLMIGVPLVSMAYGQEGLVTLFALMSVHSLIMLTMVTSIVEFADAREASANGSSMGSRSPFTRFAVTLIKAGRATLLHPVPLPILLGLIYSASGLAMPSALDQTLQLIGSAFSPIALMLVGATLAINKDLAHLRTGLWLALTKNCIHPLVLFALGMLVGLKGVGFKVMIVSAALPIGANVYLYATRYKVAEQEVTASIAASTVLALVTLSGVMLAVAHL